MRSKYMYNKNSIIKVLIIIKIFIVFSFLIHFCKSL